jgi:glutamate synthase domain-containing protein 3
MQTQETNKDEAAKLKINWNEYDAKIASVMARRTQHIMDEIEKLNDDWLELFQVAAVETNMQNESRDLNDKEKAALSAASNTP